MGWLIPVLVLFPSLLLIRFPPTVKPVDASSVNRWLALMERLGQAGVFVIPCFYRPRIEGAIAVASLVAMALSLICYYYGWLRYMRLGRKYALLFAPLWGVSLPLAVMPVVYFGAAAAMVRSWYLALATLVFAIGHLAVSMHEYRKTVSEPRSE